MSQHDVLHNQISEQRGLSGSGFTDDVDMLAFVHGGNAKRLGFAPASSFADGDVSDGSFMMPKSAATPKRLGCR
jgi:hypothetical protein